MANNPFEALTRIHEKLILSNVYIEVPVGDPDGMVMATLKMNRLAKPDARIIFKQQVPAAFYDVEWSPCDNMVYGYKKELDWKSWMCCEYVERRVEWNMDEVEVKHDDSETEIENLQADSLLYRGVCSRFVDGRHIYRNVYLPIVPCGAAGSQF